MRKRIISMLLAIVMLASMLPTYAVASATPEIYVTTNVTEPQPGDTVEVSVAIKNNPGICAANLQMTIPDVLTYVSAQEQAGAAEFTYVPETGAAQWIFDGSFSNDYTADGVLFTVTFTVDADATAKDYTIGLDLYGSLAENLGDTVGNVTATFTPGTITVKIDASGLTFNNGSDQSGLTYDAVKAEAKGEEGAITLETPGDDYYFVGWFSGLDDICKDDNGFYVIAPTATVTGISGTEFRPRYETTIPTEGTYNALWIKGDGSYVVNVNDSTSTLEIVVGTDDYTVLSTAITNAAGAARTKLVKDMTLSSVITPTAAVNLDMNGNKIYAGTTRILTLTTTGNIIESSRAGGSFGDASTRNSQYIYGGQFTKIRDVDLIGTQSAYAVYLYSAEQIENCNFEGGIYFTGTAGNTCMDNCTITSTSFLIRGVQKGATLTITNCTVTTTLSTSYAVIRGTGVPTGNYGTVILGEGNKITAANSTLMFSNLDTLTITSLDSTYQLKAGGKFADTDTITNEVTCPDGKGYAVDEEGIVVFGTACTVTYMADGALSTTKTGVIGYNADLTVTHTYGDGKNYKLLGWTNVNGGTEPLSELTLEGNTTLYAIKTQKGVMINTSPTEYESGTVSGNGSNKASAWYIYNANRLDELDKLTLGASNSRNVKLVFTAEALDAIAEQIDGDSKNMSVLLYWTTSGITSGAASRVQIALTYDDEAITIPDGVQVQLCSGKTTGSLGSLKKFVVYNVNDTGTLIESKTVTDSSYYYSYFDLTANGTYETKAQENVYLTAEQTTGSRSVTLTGTDKLIVEDASKLADMTSLTVSGGGISLTFSAEVLDSIAEEVPSGSVTISKVKTEKPETGVAALAETSVTDASGNTVNFTGDVEVLIVFPYTTATAYRVYDAVSDSPISPKATLSRQNSSYEKATFTFAGLSNFEVRELAGAIDVNSAYSISGDHTITTSGVAIVDNANDIGNLDSLTVNANAADIVFSADALDSLGTNATGTAKINVVEKTAKTGETKRVSLTVTDEEGTNEIDFTGDVTVTMTFTGEADKNYSIYYDNNGTYEPVTAEITADEAGTTYTATFTVSHFSEYVAALASDAEYTLTVEFDKDEYKTGDTVTANIYLSGSADSSAALTVGGVQFALDTTGMTGMTLTGLTSNIASGVSQISGGAFVWADTNAGLTVSSDKVQIATATFTIGTDALGKEIELGLGGTIEVVRTLDNASSPVAVVEDTAKVLYTITITDTNISDVTGATQDTTDTAKYYTYGDSAVTFKVTAPEQSVIDKVTYNNTELSGTDGTYTIPADVITADGAVTVTYIKYYTVTFAAGEHGSLSSTETAYVKEGGYELYTDTTFETEFTVPTINPAEGYRVADTEWNDGTSGVEKEAIGTDSFKPTANVTLTAQYAQNATITVSAENCTVNFTAGATQGTEDKSKYYANSKTAVTFTVTVPDGQYALNEVSYKVGDNTTYLTADDTDVYTIPASVLADGAEITLIASYSKYYVISFSAGNNGTISGATTAYMKENNAVLFSDVACTTALATLPTVSANTGYRVAKDTADEPLWNDGSKGVQSTALNASYTVTADTTLTAQYVKTYTITWKAGENGSFATDAVTTKVVDIGSSAADYISAAPVPTPAAGYVFDGWEKVMTGTITSDVEYTATYSHGTYTLSVPDIDGIVWNVTGNDVTKNTDGTYTVTHGSDVTVTMTESSDDIQVDAINVNGTALSGFAAGSTTHTWTIDGDSITDNISITIKSTETFTITIIDGGDGVSVTTTSVTYVSGASLNLDDFGITYDAGYELDKIVDASGNTLVDGAAVTADATYTVTAKHSSFTVTYPDNSTATATHGTDYEIDVDKATGGVVLSVQYTIGDVSTTVVINEDGKYVIPGAAITGNVAITFNYLDGATWEFVTYETYKALESGSGTQVAILKTDKLASGTYVLSGYADMFYSSKYEGYVYIVSTNENATTLSAKLSPSTNDVVELGYAGDINGSGTVTAADATVINAALQQTTGLTYVMDYRMRLEMDVNGDKTVTTSDITAVLEAALKALAGSN